MPPPDKIRPWIQMDCAGRPGSDEPCDFTTAAEFAGLRHEDETGHRMNWPGSHPARPLEPLSRDVFGHSRHISGGRA